MVIEELYNIYKEFPSVQTDTRKLKVGDIFFALKGPSFNGNEFARRAIDAGASYAVIDDNAYEIKGKTILVDDTLIALQQLALHHRKQFSIPFIAITGSNGKTTTKELIHAVLSSTFTTYTTEGNLNNHIGVPLTILRIKNDAKMAVIEMGANHLKEIESYCQYTLPTHGLITNCGKAHLEGFGSEAGVKKGKGELFEHLKANNGSAFVMWDYQYLREMSSGIKEVYTYGTSAADITGTVEATQELLKVTTNVGIIQTNLVGNYNLPNVLAAVAVGKYFGITVEKISSSIEHYTPNNSRSQLLVKGTNKVILDAYNANPSSMKAAIENFAGKEGTNKILALGAMAELGGDSIQEHQDLIAQISKYKWKQVLLVGGDFLNIDHPYKQFSQPAEAGEWLRKENTKHAYLLVKGSRSIQMEKILDYL